MSDDTLSLKLVSLRERIRASIEAIRKTDPKAAARLEALWAGQSIPQRVNPKPTETWLSKTAKEVDDE